MCEWACSVARVCDIDCAVRGDLAGGHRHSRFILLRVLQGNAEHQDIRRAAQPKIPPALLRRPHIRFTQVLC